MLPLIYTNTTAAAVFIAACIVWLIPESPGMLRDMMKASRRGGLVRDANSMVILIGLQWTGLALNFLLARTFPAGALGWHRTALFVLAILFMLSGVALRWVAIRTLGRYFTRNVVVASSQPVVQDGPYRFIRHPMYAGELLALLGVCISNPMLWNWSVMAVFACSLYMRIADEEALIEGYYKYSRLVAWRLFPYVW